MVAAMGGFALEDAFLKRAARELPIGQVLIVFGVVGALWLNVVGVPSPSRAGPYAVALTWALGVFGFIFVRTIELFLHRPPPDDSTSPERTEKREDR
mgnify:CR=1 FL=1